MIQTFTSPFEHSAKEPKKEVPFNSLSAAQPSESVLNNILNYSKNLDVKQAKLLPFIEFMKS